MVVNGLSIVQLSAGVVSDVNVNVAPGQTLMISGPSGCGKSCLLKGIADLIPNQGQVFLNGVEKCSIAPAIWRRQVQLVLAESRWWCASAIEHFVSPPDFQQWQRVGLTEQDGTKPIAHLSTGQKQRFSLLRALQLKPTVLLLDEPTAALDEETALLVEAFLKDYQQSHQTIILWVSHQREQIKRMSKRLLRLPALVEEVVLS